MNQLYFIYSDHCSPCRSMMKSVIQPLQDLYPNQILLFDTDIPETLMLCRKNNVTVTPTTLLVKDGQVVKVLPGRQTMEVLKAWLSQ